MLVPSVSPNYLANVGTADDRLDSGYTAVEQAVLRSIGGCLPAIEVTTPVLTTGTARPTDRRTHSRVSGELMAAGPATGKGAGCRTPDIELAVSPSRLMAAIEAPLLASLDY